MTVLTRLLQVETRLLDELTCHARGLRIYGLALLSLAAVYWGWGCRGFLGFLGRGGALAYRRDFLHLLLALD